MKRNVYVCDCGERLQVRQVVKNAVRECPACKRWLPQKIIMQCYHRRRQRASKIRLTCSCGKKISFPFPTGACKCVCPKCGARLWEIKTKVINGVALPRYIIFKKSSSEVNHE